MPVSIPSLREGSPRPGVYFGVTAPGAEQITQKREKESNIYALSVAPFNMPAAAVELGCNVC